MTSISGKRFLILRATNTISNCHQTLPEEDAFYRVPGWRFRKRCHTLICQLMFRPDADTHGDDDLNNQPGYAFFTYSIDLSGDNDPVVTVNIDVTPDGNNSPNGSNGS